MQVVASPCWDMALPNIISAILVKSLGPIPRHVSWMHLPISSPRTPASHDGKAVRHVGISLQCNINRGVFSRLQSFVYLQAPTFARPAGCTHPRDKHWMARPFTPRIARMVTCTEMWHHYVFDRAINTTGLSPVGSQPCRLLRRDDTRTSPDGSVAPPAVRAPVSPPFAQSDPKRSTQASI